MGRTDWIKAAWEMPSRLARSTTLASPVCLTKSEMAPANLPQSPSHVTHGLPSSLLPALPSYEERKNFSLSGRCRLGFRFTFLAIRATAYRQSTRSNKPSQISHVRQSCLLTNEERAPFQALFPYPDMMDPRRNYDYILLRWKTIATPRSPRRKDEGSGT